MSDRNLKILLPIVVIVFGIAAAGLLASSRKAPARSERPALGPLVEVVSVSRTDVPVAVRGHGEVIAKTAVNLVPQVSGQITVVHPGLVAGGFFSAGETLVQIDPRDYELAVWRAQAAVARTQVALEREQAEAAVARQEWEALNPGSEPTSGLVVREPQVRQAQAELDAALADLDVARLNLERTSLSLPFDGVVISKQVDLGQFVGAGASIANVYGTDLVEVRVPLEDRELAWFAVPNGSRTEAPLARIEASFAGSTHTWEGRVVRTEAEVDSSSRMVPVIIEVRNPFAHTEDRPPLIPGSFVEVEISGRSLTNIVPIPRHAVREGNTVWVVVDGTLAVRPVDLVRSDRQNALVGSGLSSGDLVIVSALDAVTDGMRVRTSGEPIAVEES